MINIKSNFIAIVLIILVFGAFIVFIVPNNVSAQVQDPTYTPLSPLSESQTKINLKDPSGYFTNMFSVFVSILAIIAVIKLMFCGFQYMTSEAISSKSEAKKCIWTIIGGLFLILLSFLILTTINKDLVTLSFFDTVTTEVNKAKRDVTIYKTINPKKASEARVAEIDRLITERVQAKVPGDFNIKVENVRLRVRIYASTAPISDQYKRGERFLVLDIAGSRLNSSERNGIRTAIASLCAKTYGSGFTRTTTLWGRDDLCSKK